MTDRDERLERDAAALQKRSFGVNWKLIGSILLFGTLGVGYFGSRIAVEMAAEESEQQMWEQQQLLNDVMYGGPDLGAMPPVVPDAPQVTLLDAVEYEIRIGEFETELDRDRYTLPGDVPIRIEPSETLVFSHERLSFRHPSTTRVSLDESDELLAVEVTAPEEVSLLINELASDVDPHGFVEEYTASMERTLGVDRDPTGTRGRIGRDEASGFRVIGPTGFEVLVYGVTISAEDETDRSFGVVLRRPNQTASFEPIRNTARTIRADAREPGGVLEIAYLLEHHPIPLDTPTIVSALPGSPEVLVTRRDQVLRRFAGWTFEHPHDLIPSSTDHDVMQQLSLRHGAFMVMLAEAPFMQPQEVLSAMGGGLEGPRRPMTRTIAGQPREGQRIDAQIGEERLRAEIYAFVLSGKTIGISLQYAPSEEAAVEAYFLPIASSLR